MPAALVAGRALRVPAGAAFGRPFPRPAAAGPRRVVGGGQESGDGRRDTYLGAASPTSIRALRLATPPPRAGFREGSAAPQPPLQAGPVWPVGPLGQRDAEHQPTTLPLTSCDWDVAAGSATAVHRAIGLGRVETGRHAQAAVLKQSPSLAHASGVESDDEQRPHRWTVDSRDRGRLDTASVGGP